MGCGVAVNKKLSEEHILPKWLYPHVVMATVKLKHNETKGGKEEAARELILNNFVNRSVCAACNNGWMSDLEIRVKPILLPLIRGEIRIKSLGTDDRQTLSRWAFKTAFMMLVVQRAINVPWDLFSLWASAGAKALSSGSIFARSLSEPHRSHRSFGYLVSEDEWGDGSTSHVRITIHIQAVVLLVLLPIEQAHYVIGIEDHNFCILFSQDVEINLLPRLPASTLNSYEEFLDEISQRVRTGKREGHAAGF